MIHTRRPAFRLRLTPPLHDAAAPPIRRARNGRCFAKATAAPSPSTPVEGTPSAVAVLRDVAERSVPMVMLKRGNAFYVERGNNLIFAEAVLRVSGPEAKLGDEVVVCDGSAKIIGWGIYNPRSVYRVRMMQTLRDCHDEPEAILDVKKVFLSRLEAALKLRANFLALPSSATNAFRVVNSDGDRLSGVVIDRFADVAVVHSGVSWLELRRQCVVALLRRALDVDIVVWRLRPSVSDQEGVANAQEAVYASDPDLTLDSEIEVVENGLSFRMSLSGQKTGFYSDQRENRLFLRTVVGGKSVLDLCCYTGGFALNAAKGGAQSVLGIDSSKPAIELAIANAQLNGAAEICRFECGDILNRLQVAAVNGQTWDVVILDPPKLAFSRHHLNRSLNRYRKLNRAAMRVVRVGGLLVTCSCSGVVDAKAFVRAVGEAATRVGRRLTILRQSGAGPDHVHDPNHPEGDYLKCLFVRVS